MSTIALIVRNGVSGSFGKLSLIGYCVVALVNDDELGAVIDRRPID